MTTEPFTPHADLIQTAWVFMCQQAGVPTQPSVDELEAEFDRFLARVRRDAKAEALRDAADDLRAEGEREALADFKRHAADMMDKCHASGDHEMASMWHHTWAALLSFRATCRARQEADR